MRRGVVAFDPLMPAAVVVSVDVTIGDVRPDDARVADRRPGERRLGHADARSSRCRIRDGTATSSPCSVWTSPTRISTNNVDYADLFVPAADIVVQKSRRPAGGLRRRRGDVHRRRLELRARRVGSGRRRTTCFRRASPGVVFGATHRQLRRGDGRLALPNLPPANLPGLGPRCAAATGCADDRRHRRRGGHVREHRVVGSRRRADLRPGPDATTPTRRSSPRLRFLPSCT